MVNDPYQPPVVDPEPDCSDASPAPPVVIEHLRCTRPWVKFCSIAGFITSGFLLLIALITLRGILQKTPAPETILMAGFFLVLAILFIIPSFWLSRYEKAITRVVVSNRIEDLEEAVSHQRAFWKQMAIVILVMLIIYLLTVAFSAIVLLSSR